VKNTEQYPEKIQQECADQQRRYRNTLRAAAQGQTRREVARIHIRSSLRVCARRQAAIE
jgi:hypothetical protein